MILEVWDCRAITKLFRMSANDHLDLNGSNNSQSRGVAYNGNRNRNNNRILYIGDSNMTPTKFDELFLLLSSTNLDDLTSHPQRVSLAVSPAHFLWSIYLNSLCWGLAFFVQFIFKQSVDAFQSKMPNFECEIALVTFLHLRNVIRAQWHSNVWHLCNSLMSTKSDVQFSVQKFVLQTIQLILCASTVDAKIS